jgi:hypothetical protein
MPIRIDLFMMKTPLVSAMCGCVRLGIKQNLYSGAPAEFFRRALGGGLGFLVSNQLDGVEHRLTILISENTNLRPYAFNRKPVSPA